MGGYLSNVDVNVHSPVNYRQPVSLAAVVESVGQTGNRGSCLNVNTGYMGGYLSNVDVNVHSPVNYRQPVSLAAVVESVGQTGNRGSCLNVNTGYMGGYLSNVDVNVRSPVGMLQTQHVGDRCSFGGTVLDMVGSSGIRVSTPNNRMQESGTLSYRP
ncbi:hypothetical protein Tco_0929076 [Tanacetum coccineum]